MRAAALLTSVLVIVGLCAAPALARGKKSVTAPGKYSEWNDEIDELEVVSTFAAADYEKIVVEQFDGSDTELPEKDDNTYLPVKQVLGDTATPFVMGYLEADGRRLDASVASGGSPGPKTLLVRGKVLEMNPGSQAARYWGGFGAGAAGVKLSGEVVDAESGKVLLRFTQERRSGVGLAGGDYSDLLNRNLRAIGEDLAFILQAF